MPGAYAILGSNPSGPTTTPASHRFFSSLNLSPTQEVNYLSAEEGSMQQPPSFLKPVGD